MYGLDRRRLPRRTPIGPPPVRTAWRGEGASVSGRHGDFVPLLRLGYGGSIAGTRTESIMTKKNVKKLAARARQDSHGGKYQSHLRRVGGADGGSKTALAEPSAALRTVLPHIRHVYLDQPTEYELDVFTVNQSVSYFIAKFKGSGWSAEEHRLDPVYHRAIWAQDRQARESDLRAVAARALQNVRPDGHVLVVHAPGRLAMMWSDHPIPRDGDPRITQMFGPPLRAVPRQPISEGPPPPRWPDAQKGGTITVVHRFDPDDPKYKTVRLSTGAYQDPMRPVEVVNGDRLVRVWMLPSPEGMAGWRFEIKHVEGPWPLLDAERLALEEWLEDFAETEWPERTMLWPATYMAKTDAWGSSVTKEVLARSKGGITSAHYLQLRFDPLKGQSVEDALAEARREARTRSDLLEVIIRRMDRPGHPTLCTWKRGTQADTWKFAWGQGADDAGADPLRLDE